MMSYVENHGMLTVSRRLGRLVEDLRARATRTARVRQIERELEGCSDRSLADMGLHRSDIPRIARQTVDSAARG